MKLPWITPRNRLKAALLKQRQLQTQLDCLRSQVNPHFLFNNLNTLSSLIGENPGRAEKFLDELSKVYRYLLRYNENTLTTLYAELQFIQSYHHLLKARYGDSLVLQVQVDAAHHYRQLPPQTLQLLVENAVKHNIMSKEMPLQIIIATENNKLVVSNSLQRKNKTASSTYPALANIDNKYKLLKEGRVEVREDQQQFKVLIPLIEPDVNNMAAYSMRPS